MCFLELIKKIIFRVDSSMQIGSGHLMRCLSLADQLKTKAEIIFISRNLMGNFNYLIKKNGFICIELCHNNNENKLSGYEKWLTVGQKEDAEEVKEILNDLSVDLLVADSYAIDEIWENTIRPYVKKIMVIDDLANRKHDCDILLDQNYYIDMNTRYNGLVNDNCKLLLGPKYALLREEFYREKKNQRQRDGQIKNILVFFGGSDLTNETMKALRALVLLNREDTIVNVVVGGSNQYKNEVKEFCDKYKWMNYYCQIDNMAEMMNLADLAIGAGGTTTWERCFLGLPAIVIAVAENQIKIAEDCDREGFIKYLGVYSSVEVEHVFEIISNIDKIYNVFLHKINNINFNTIKVGKVIL